MNPISDSCNKPERILVVRLGAMGDVVNVMPAVTNLRMAFPSAHITWLVEDRFKNLVESLQCVDDVLVFPRKQLQGYVKRPLNYAKLIKETYTFLKKLRGGRFDVALDFHGNFKSGLLTYLSNTKTRIGFSKDYCKEFNYIFTNLQVTPKQKKLNRVDKYLSLLNSLGIEVKYRRPAFSIPNADYLYVNDFIRQNQLEQKPIAIIHPGTSLFGKYKRWLPKNYASLADRLIQELNYSVVFTWGADERGIAEEILSMMRNKAIIACSTPSARHLIALIQRAAVFIGSDTGPTHIAGCLGTHTVAIFGPKDPSIYAPYGENTLVVRKELPCSPCEKRTCSHVTCINSITSDDVFDAVRKFAVNGLEK